MNKRIIVSLLVLTLFSTFLVNAENKFLIIDNKEELYEFAESVNSGNSYEGMNIILNCDIYLNNNLLDSNGRVVAENPEVWTPIGTEQNPFKGNFNGNGNSVCGIYINNLDYFGGLFGVISNAAVTNVCVKDSYIRTNRYSGAVVGYANSNSVISSCLNSGSRIYTAERSGGIVGWTDYADIYNCVNAGYVFSDRCSGGIVGDVYVNGRIYNCQNAGIVDGSGDLAGGISGGTTNADIANCLNIGEVKNGYHIAGGLGSRTLTNCFAYRNEEFNSHIGGEAYLFDNLSAELSETLNINGQPCTTVVDALNAYKGTMVSPVALTDWSQGDLSPSVDSTVDEFSETTVLSYDAETQTAIIYPKTEGTHIVVFASYGENGRFDKIDLVEYTFVSGVYAEVSQEDISFTLGTGDKVMILSGETFPAPLCENLIIE